MSTFVVLSFAVAVAIVAVTIVVGFRLAGAARTMARGVNASAARLRPLTEELSEELAVTQTELAHLQANASRIRSTRER